MRDILLDLRARDTLTRIFGVGCDAFLDSIPQHYISLMNMRASERKRRKGGSDDGSRDKSRCARTHLPSALS